MALRGLLFSSDQNTAEPICQVLAGLGVEGEICSHAVTAVERVTGESFQIVIIDWDNQPEAGLLLSSARERKASDRPLTLAIVSSDASVPQALQAGANSILRKPIQVNQVKDTLTTARDLLRAKQESAQAAAAAASASSSAGPIPPVIEPAGEKMLRAGEFLQSASPTPAAHFDTEPDPHPDESEPVDALKELEPMAASVAEEQRAPDPPPPSPGEPRGLAWYLNARGITNPAAPAPIQSAPPPAPNKPELLGFDQAPSTSAAPTPAPRRTVNPAQTAEHAHQEHKNEAALFAYISGETEATQGAKPRFRLPKGPIFVALALATCAIVAAPQAPWHANVKVLWARGQKMTHAWLNPQPVTTTPAPRAHEDFARAGDEYKLPVAENIPDATTDPSQIRVTPVIDPTAKKPNPAIPDPALAPADAAPANPNDPAQPSPAQVQENQPAPLSGTTAAPASGLPANPPVSAPESATTAPPAAAPQHNDPPAASTPPPQAPPRNPQPRYVSAPATPGIPSSLKSQMASMTPDAGGNKPVEAALPSIEPVTVSEATERGLLADQPPIDYPANAKTQQGTVILQVLVGRDGTVQDAKFMQGSLAFARTAIDGVKQWKFKPYTMNGRPVSVQTQMTMTFKPGQQ